MVLMAYRFKNNNILIKSTVWEETKRELYFLLLFCMVFSLHLRSFHMPFPQDYCWNSATVII